MINTQAKQMLNDFGMRLQQQGLTMEQYMQFTGADQNRMMSDMSEQAKKRIESRLVLEAIAAAEGLTASEEEISAELKKMADAYGMEVDALAKFMGENEEKSIAEDIAVQKAVDFLVENAVEEAKGEE